MYATKQSVLTRKRNELPELLEVGADVDYVKDKVSELKHLKTSMELMSCTPRVLLMSAVLLCVMSLIGTDHVSEWRISAHAQSVLAAGQKHHNSSPLASACNMVTNKDLKR